MIARSALETNPFHVLGVSPRDSKTTILSAARDQVLTADPNLIEEARSTLITPRSRIDAEVGWLPGVAPSRSAALVSDLSHSADAFPEFPCGASALAEANLLAAYLERTAAADLGLGLGNAICALSDAAERLSPAEVLRAIDEDRIASGFPLIGNVQRLQDPLEKQRRYFVGVVRCILDQLPTWEMVDLITDLVARSTENGTIHPPRLIEDIVDHYEVRARKALEMAEGNLKKRIDFLISQSATQGSNNVPSALNGVIREARQWDRIAQPIQLSAQARGVEHPPSTRVGWKLRKLAVDLNNDHSLSAEAMTLVRELQELLAEVPELAEKLREDEDALHRLLRHPRVVNEDGVYAFRRKRQFGSDRGGES